MLNGNQELCLQWMKQCEKMVAAEGCAWPSSRVGSSRGKWPHFVWCHWEHHHHYVKSWSSQIRNCPEHSRILSPWQHGTICLFPGKAQNGFYRVSLDDIFLFCDIFWGRCGRLTSFSYQCSGGVEHAKDVLFAFIGSQPNLCCKVKMETCQTHCMMWAPFLQVTQQIMHITNIYWTFSRLKGGYQCSPTTVQPSTRRSSLFSEELCPERHR